MSKGFIIWQNIAFFVEWVDSIKASAKYNKHCYLPMCSFQIDCKSTYLISGCIQGYRDQLITSAILICTEVLILFWFLHQYQISGPHCLKVLFVNASNYGLSGLKSDQILLTSHTISIGDAIHIRGDIMHKEGEVFHKGAIRNTIYSDLQNTIHANPLIIISIKLLTHFSVIKCNFIYILRTPRTTSYCLSELTMT